jgi:hypothetical protein
VAIQLQLRRGTNLDNQTFVGAEGEATVDLDIKSIRIHDGVRPGGYELARSNLLNVSIGKTLLPTLNAVHDLGSPSYKFKDFYVANNVYLGAVAIQPIPEGIRVVTNTGYFDLTQGIDEGSSPTFTTITLGDTTISERLPFGITITKGATQIDVDQSLTATANINVNSVTASAEITVGNTSIVEDLDGISFDNGTTSISLNQSLTTTDDVEFNSVTFGGVTISADTPSGIKFVEGINTYGINQSLKKSDDVEFNSVTSDLIGNATSSDKLKTPFNIEISGDIDVTISGIDGSSTVNAASTLKTVNSNVGVFGDASRVPVLTVNEKGLITGVETRPVVAMATDFIIVPDIAARDSLESELLKFGMLVLTQDTNFLWQLMTLTPDLTGGVTSDTMWSAVTKDPEITLSDSGFSAANTVPEWKDVYGSTWKDSGKFYFEILNTNNDDDRAEAGLSNLNKDINLVLEFNTVLERYKKQNGVESPTGLPFCGDGQVFRVAVDFDLGRMWFGVGNSWEFMPGGPDASFVFDANTALYPFASLYGDIQSIRIKTNPAQFSFTPPVDFLPWSDDIPVNPPIPAWERFYVSPTRKIATFNTGSLDALSYYDFDLMLGNCLIVYKLEVSEQCMFEVHESSARADINPYKFVTPTMESPPFVDNGLTYLADGAVLRGRRYHIWASMEGGFDGDNRIYGRIYNHTENDYPSGINVTIWYMPIEKSAIF